MHEVVTASAIARVLREPQRQMIARALRVLGEERCITLLTEALLIEHQGGMWLKDGSRRRSPGGVFLHLVRERSTGGWAKNPSDGTLEPMAPDPVLARARRAHALLKPAPVRFYTLDTV